jgi:predicted nucleic-acid-binding Zn-ribbon protein
MAPRAPRGFTREHLQKLQELFDSRGIEVKCPMCGGEDFAFEGLMEAPEIIYVRGGGLTQTGSGIAMVEAVCKNCTYIMFFHAARAGLLE